MREHIESMTNPNISVPVTVVGIFAENLPLIINVCSLVYLVLLITHKGWQMYKEWKRKDESSE